MHLQAKVLKSNVKHGGTVVGQHDGSGVVQGSQLLDLKVRQGARAPNSFKTLRRKLKLIIRALQALPGLLRVAFRPLFIASSAILFLLDCLWKRRILKFLKSVTYDQRLSRKPFSSVIGLIATGLWFRELTHITRDPVVHRALWGGHTVDSEARPGLYYALDEHAYNQGSEKRRAFERIQKVMEKANHFEDLPYVAPRSMLTSDFTTILPAISYRAKPIRYWRVCFPSSCKSEPHAISLDWAFPIRRNESSTKTKVLLIMAGVGGDSNAPYVRDAVHTALEKGWVACVLMARGMGNSVSLNDIRNIFNPVNTQDFADTLRYVDCTCEDSDVYLLGFSLGALTICNFLGRHAEKVPHSVRGAVAVSGGFKVDFMDWHRYTEVYQPLLVPNLVLQVVSRYGHQIDEICGEMEIDEILNCTTYRELHDRFFARISAEAEGSSGGSFVQWKLDQEGLRHRGNIKVPLLLFAACDDPLHNVDMIGAETKRGVPIENPNVVYFLTEEGGHVGWPTQSWPSNFEYINSVFVRFFDSLEGCSA